MENISPWILFTICLMAGYGILILYLVYFYYHTPKIKISSKDVPAVSILIPFRNEEKNLPRLIESLLQQDYPSEKVEIIFINDHSDDQSISVYNSLVQDSTLPFRLISLPENQFGKREALKAGLLQARFSWILSTDADVILRQGWIRCMSPLRGSGINLLLGPVTFFEKNNPLVSLQILEFSSLMLFTRGSSNARNPLLSNGANMAFEKNLFLQYLSEAPPSKTGDDMLFLQWLKKKEKGTIFFQSNPSALVCTWAKTNLKELMNQRSRWFSKYSYYHDTGILTSGLLVLFTNLYLLLLAAMLFFLPELKPVLMASLMAKLAFDTISVIPFLGYIHQRKKMIWIPALFLLYPLYSMALLIRSMMKASNWKGRSLIDQN